MIGNAPSSDRLLDALWVSACCRGLGWSCAAATTVVAYTLLPFGLAGAIALMPAGAWQRAVLGPARETMGA